MIIRAVILFICCAIASCNQNDATKISHFHSLGGMFARKKNTNYYYYIDVYPNTSPRKFIYEYHSLEHLCNNLPKFETPPLFRNYSRGEDVDRIIGTTDLQLIALDEREIRQIEVSCYLSGNKLFMREGDQVHPSLDWSNTHKGVRTED